MRYGLWLFFFVLLYFFFFFFFFQAEDGIRDPLMTGVQTCALPISARRIGLRGIRKSVQIFVGRQGFDGKLLEEKQAVLRSEERRVGKECRARWSREQ